MKGKTIIKVPKGVHYLSDFRMEDGSRFTLPNGILNKELTGCGGTTLALESGYKTIICSPRKKLLENKAAQYPSALLVVGGVLKEAITDYLQKMEVPKVLVTYDSLPKVLGCIDDVSDWQVVVDEFQCLLNDSTFKADTEMQMLEQLKQLPYVTYLSATPILDKYLDQIAFFDDVPYYQLEWEDKYKVTIHRKKVNKPISAATAIIRDYQKGNYPILPSDGGTIQSKEAVIFLNSVTNIVNIIKQTHLNPEDVNIIVATNEDNDTIIQKLGAGYVNGRIPLKGEKHKMITMCTSTAYMGVDFYSTNASTFVISDCTRANTSVDIATELAQIAGRQRLDSNPFRYHLFFFYNTNVEDVAPDVFEAEMEKKLHLTKAEIDYYNGAPEELKPKLISDNIRNRKILKYSDTYTLYDEAAGAFTYNPLAVISDRFAYDVQQYNYKNGVLVRKQLEDTNKFDVSEQQSFQVYQEVVKQSITNTAFIDRMQAYCEYKEDDGFASRCIAAQMMVQYPELGIYYDALGAEKIKALSYQESKLKDEYAAISKGGSVAHQLGLLIKAGDKISKVGLKAKMQMVYDRLNLKKKAKATDVTKYGYQVKEVKIDDGKGNRINGFEIL